MTYHYFLHQLLHILSFICLSLANSRVLSHHKSQKPPFVTLLQGDRALGSSYENGVQGCGIIYIRVWELRTKSDCHVLPGERYQRWINTSLTVPIFCCDCHPEMTSSVDSEFHVLVVSLSLALLPLAGVVFSIYLTYSRWLRSPFRGLSFPPGPPPKNIISGNSDDIPLSQPWHTYAKWARVYGKQCFNHIISFFVHWLLP